LNLVGAVLGSPVGDLGHTFERLNGTPLAGLPALVVAALTHAYPGLDRVHEILATPEVREVFENTKLGAVAPTPPVLVIQAVQDEVIAVEDIDALVASYAEGGTPVAYHRDWLNEHILMHPTSARMALRWLSDRLAGKPVPHRLVVSTWPTLLNPLTYLGMARLAGIAARVVTGRKVRHRPL
jgi:hypothetical protein